MKRKSVFILLFLAVLTFVFGFLREYLLPIYGTTMLALILTPSIFVSIAAIYIRFALVNPQKISETLRDNDNSFKIQRFYNFMPLAAICSTLADFGIVLSLIAGIVLFFIAQIFHIIAFSGIIQLSPKAISAKEINPM